MSMVFTAGAGFIGYRLLLASTTHSTFFHRFPEPWDDPEYGLLDTQVFA
jgi:hypothetical protein